MSNCPKCGKRLHLYNVSQFCPNCKVNLRFCNFEENFYREAKEAELNLARMHVKLRHMKVAFIGSKLAIARLVAVVFPIIALVLFSAGAIGINLPFYSGTINLKAIDFYNSYNDGSIFYVLKMSSSNLAADQFAAARNMILCYLAAAIFAVFILLLTILCFISYKNMPKITAAVAGVGTVVSVVMQILIGLFSASLSDSIIISASSSFGLYIFAATLAIVAVSNALLVKFKPKVEYEEGDWERYQVLLQIKRGEVDFDSLPQPIIETTETREIEEEIAKGLKHFEDEHGREEIEAGEDETSDVETQTVGADSAEKQ